MTEQLKKIIQRAIEEGELINIEEYGDLIIVEYFPSSVVKIRIEFDKKDKTFDMKAYYWVNGKEIEVPLIGRYQAGKYLFEILKVIYEND